MSQEFRDYVTSSGVDFDILTIEQKREWRETFDKSRPPDLAPQPAGNFPAPLNFIELQYIHRKFSRICIYFICM
jgi:hypothetical protein